MQKGLLYMNSLEYFSTLEDEENIALRVDEKEKIFGILRAGSNDKFFSTISLRVGDGKEIDLGSDAILTADFPRPKNTMIFCMGALSDDENGRMPGEVDDKVHFDPRFLEFGSHILIITEPREFGERISVAISNNKNLFGSKLFNSGCGLVKYEQLEKYSGPIGLFIKDEKYSWQLEYRVAFGAEDNCLNTGGALEFNIGDISDISHIMPIQALLDEPLSIKRRTYRKTGNANGPISG
ncbi:hypothetical protein FCL40_16060 [Ferrimonas sediminicola]|uniref:Uncharacterized protein n=2 Tax=Ferrimonas sediminicola TaxID=2569538 RepID=A0A4U1BAC3_9GAMM|nr:hypothetical protein FCL40_16060 [Ferrimonas sediminicola]